MAWLIAGFWKPPSKGKPITVTVSDDCQKQIRLMYLVYLIVDFWQSVYKKLSRSASQKLYVVTQICRHLLKEAINLHLWLLSHLSTTNIKDFWKYFFNSPSLKPAVTLTFDLSRSPWNRCLPYTLLDLDLNFGANRTKTFWVNGCTPKINDLTPVTLTFDLDLWFFGNLQFSVRL